MVAIRGRRNQIVGAGCLVSSDTVLTCRHVIGFALGNKRRPKVNDVVRVTMIGVSGSPDCIGTVASCANGEEPENDLAVLKITKLPAALAISPIEFITPMRHGRKLFSVLGFPDSGQQGRNAIGVLQAADAKGLVQMDSHGALMVEGGFSGAPVWSPDLGGFVGIVVTELSEERVSWCIPSRILCRFHPSLQVKFRIPKPDRPQIHDYEEDDPNLQLFGNLPNNGIRVLRAAIRKRGPHYRVDLKYKVLSQEEPARGGYVTFITHPSFSSRKEDAYELFSRVNRKGVATTHFYCTESFTVAAIGDAGDTALTVDLAQVKPRPSGFK